MSVETVVLLKKDDLNSLFKLFEYKCVLEVCVHIHPIIIKIHQCFFFISILKSPFSCEAVLSTVRMT